MIHEIDIPAMTCLQATPTMKTATSPSSGSCSPQLPDFKYKRDQKLEYSDQDNPSSMKKSGHNEYMSVAKDEAKQALLLP